MLSRLVTAQQLDSGVSGCAAFDGLREVARACHFNAREFKEDGATLLGMATIPPGNNNENNINTNIDTNNDNTIISTCCRMLLLCRL